MIAGTLVVINLIKAVAREVLETLDANPPPKEPVRMPAAVARSRSSTWLAVHAGHDAGCSLSEVLWGC